jgi:hypothetical protein
VTIVIEQTLPNPEEMLAGIVERQRQMLMAGRKATFDALGAYAQTAMAFAESQEKLADTTEVEGLSRLLRAQASFTREVLEATTKFAHEVMEEE